MPITYRATLRGNCLEWSGDAPVRSRPEKPVPVYVTILDEKATPAERLERGRRMAAVLGRLAAAGALAELTDAAVWEREIREDRALPDRGAGSTRRGQGLDL